MSILTKIQETAAVVFDSRHFFHPKTPAKGDPGLFQRIAGIGLMILSIPFTLCIYTGFSFYWAHRKVEQIKKFPSATTNFPIDTDTDIPIGGNDTPYIERDIVDYKKLVPHIDKTGKESIRTGGSMINEKLVPDVDEEILDRLSPEDLKNITLVSKSGAIRTKEQATKRIQEYIKYASYLNSALKQLDANFSLIGESDFEETHSKIKDNDRHFYAVPFFKFNEKKWLELLKEWDRIGNENDKVPIDCVKQMEECRLDLVEALSEYNVAYKYLCEKPEHSDEIILNDIDKKIFETEELGEKDRSSMSEIINEALETCKGNLEIVDYQGYGEPFSNSLKFFCSQQNEDGGPYYFTRMSSIENNSWQDFNYERHPKNPKGVSMGGIIHFDRIVGKRENDRLRVKSEYGDGFFIFRLRNGDKKLPFEQRLIRDALKEEERNQKKKGAKFGNFDRRKNTIKELRQKYGNLTDQLIQNKGLTNHFKKLKFLD